MKRRYSSLLAGVALAAAVSVSAQNATIVNARIAVGDGPVIRSGSIVVRSGRIVAVVPGRPAQLVGTVIDAAGMTAVAGFIDGHKHLYTSPLGEKQQMQDLIDNGFTTVLSALGPAKSNLALIRKIDSGEILGPRIIASGRVDLHGTPEQARAKIRALAAEGVRFTGEMAVTPEPGPTAQELAVLRAAVAEGRKDGVQVQVHAVSTPAMLGATAAGVRHEVHLPNKDFMSYDAAEQIASSGTIVLDLISFGAPIINVFESDNVPRFRTGLLWPESIAGANLDDQGRATGTEAAYTLINARRIWDATGGEGLGFGSDQDYPVHDVLEHELKSMMVMFSMQDVLRILGPNTAAYLGLQNQIGTLDPGKRADIVLVEGDPFSNYLDLLHTEVVLKDGKVVVDRRGAASRSSGPAAAAAAPGQPHDAVGTLTLQNARPGQAPARGCASLASLRLPQGRITSVRQVAGVVRSPALAPFVAVSVPVAPPLVPSRANAPPLPPYCAVTALIRPSHGSRIRMELWLPASGWNANFMMVGNAGWGGSIDRSGMSDPLRRGFAVASTDTGHRGDRGTFAFNQHEKLVDFAYRAVHETAMASRAVIKAFYGGAPRYSYWLGESPAAGRQGLKEAQMYPADFDGLIIDAPANAWTHTQTRLLVDSNLNRTRAGSAILGVRQLAILHRAVLAQCDGADGLRDGQIEDPRSCAFKAESIVCKAGEPADGCLTPAQARVADELYAPLLDPLTHREIAAGMPPGSELNWSRVIAGPPATAADTYALALGNRNWNARTLNLTKDLAAAERADADIDATTTDLSAFMARGGKIIEYQGWDSPVVPAQDSIRYYQQVAAREGGLARTRTFYRLFLIPATSRTERTYAIDWIRPLEEWVERGQAPEVVLAQHLPPPGVTPQPPRGLVFEPEFGLRSMCAYPDIARLVTGRGEVPVDWRCLPGPHGARLSRTAGGGR